MSVAAVYTSNVTVVETLGTNVPYAAASGKAITHSLFNSTASLTGASAVPVTKTAFFQQALTAGTATIDLRALPGTNGVTVDGNGLKVQIVKLRAHADNANPIVITEGASDGYELLGDGFEVALKAGQEVTLYLTDSAPDISASAKTIDISGTGTQVLECAFVMG